MFGFLFFFFLSYSIVMAEEFNPIFMKSTFKVEEFNPILMKSTFKLEGKDSRDSTVLGTVFVLSIDSTREYRVLVTAAHVLNDIHSDTAKLIIRKKKADGSWKKNPYPIKIRDKGRALWVQHDKVDVAVMYVRLPEYVDIPLVSTNLLADDKDFEKYEIHPGDEIMCLGYPLGKKEGPFGFPILQSGRIATYPLLPTKQIKTFICDLKISRGYSGGPVYLIMNSARTIIVYNITYGKPIQFIVGLISKIPITQEELDRLYEEEKRYYFGFARAVHASFIKETIDKLPKRE